MFRKIVALFKREDAQAKADVSALVQRIRAKVVSEADVVFVSLKRADASSLAACKKILNELAPDIRFVVHDEGVKVSAVIKRLVEKVKAAGRRAPKVSVKKK